MIHLLACVPCLYACRAGEYNHEAGPLRSATRCPKHRIHLLALRACMPDARAPASGSLKGPEPRRSKHWTHLLALRACMPAARAGTITKRQRVGCLRTRNESLDSLACAACLCAGRASGYKHEAPASGSLKGPEPRRSKHRTHLLALRACMPAARAGTSTKRQRVGCLRTRNESLDSLACAACLCAGRASGYKHEAQASGSRKDPKRSTRNAGLTCLRCVLVCRTRERVQARSASEWVP